VLEASQLDELALPGLQVGNCCRDLQFGAGFGLRVSGLLRLWLFSRRGRKLELLDDLERVEELVGGLGVQEAVPVLPSAL
jgi:hypothetical protein